MQLAHRIQLHLAEKGPREQTSNSKAQRGSGMTGEGGCAGREAVEHALMSCGSQLSRRGGGHRLAELLT